MTRQEIFDTAARHLLTQREKSGEVTPITGSFRCLYRGPHGRKCAAGVLIPDDEYSGEIEGSGVRSDNLAGIWQRVGITAMELPLLSALQGVHDDALSSDWHSELKGIAMEYGLSPAILDEFPNA